LALNEENFNKTFNSTLLQSWSSFGPVVSEKIKKKLAMQSEFPVAAICMLNVGST
jgi:hypothetical protein